MLGYLFMFISDAFSLTIFGLGVENDEDMGVGTFESDSNDKRFYSIGYSISLI